MQQKRFKLTSHAKTKLFIDDDSNSHTPCNVQAVYQRRFKLSHSMQRSSCLSKTTETVQFHAMICLFIKDDSNHSRQRSSCLSKTTETFQFHAMICLFIKDDSNHSMQRPSCLSKTTETFQFHAMICLFIKDDSNSHSMH